jgi:protein SCO1
LGVKIRQRRTDELHPGGEERSVYVRNGWAVGLLMVLAVVGWLALTFSHATAEREALPRLGPAPEVSLTTQDGKRLSLKDLRGKVVAVTFIS